MREIKFRGYCKDRKVWIYFTLSDIDLGILSIPFDELYIIDQFTGLKDKNGKEIYEGDVLKRSFIVDDDEIQSNIFIVGIRNQRFAYLLNDKDNWSDIFGYDEVIGNIYENPALLEGENNGK